MSPAGSPTGLSAHASAFPHSSHAQSGDPGVSSTDGVDRALSVTVPAARAEEAGAILMDMFGPYEEVAEGDTEEVTLVLYPEGPFPSADEVRALLPAGLRTPGTVRVESSEVARDWVEGWKDHFSPIVIERVRIRPPWEPPLDPCAASVEVVINPGLGFGTGLHPTTRGTLRLLQAVADLDGSPSAGEARGPTARGPLLDAGTGSGVLAVAGALLGWGPVVAFDNDPVALVSARENVAANRVGETVELHEAGVSEVPAEWSAGATVLANMTLEPVLALIEQVAAAGSAGRPARMVVSGILAGAQERELLRAAHAAGFIPGRRVYEAEWLSLELFPGATHGAKTEGP